jgi:DNA excision repair protein ERCC-2
LTETAKEQTDKPVIRVSVRDLVFFALRSGDLVYRHFGGVQAVEGVRGHIWLQERREPPYSPEVSVKKRIPHTEFDLEIAGRIDGVMERDDRIVIEEIKTTRLEFDEIPDRARRIHRGQAAVYAAIYGEEQHLDALDIQLTYLHIDRKTSQENRESLTLVELQQFLNEVVAIYLAWAEQVFSWQQTRDKSIAELKFPFANFREGQRRFAKAVYQTLSQGGQLLVQAPTGTGKSVGTLFPALKGLGKREIDRIFYLTSKTVGSESAHKALQVLRENGLRVKSLHMTAKRKLCKETGDPCNAEVCPLALGYYDRLSQALNELWKVDHFDRAEVEKLAQTHQLCAYELSLDLANWVDVIIGDVNYAFDPGAHLRRFFSDDRTPQILLVDEAHNLVDRARDMYTGVVTKKGFREIKTTFAQRDPAVSKAAGKVVRQFNALVKPINSGGETTLEEIPDKFSGALQQFCQAYEDYFANSQESLFPEAAPDLFFEARRFLRILEMLDESYKIIGRKWRSDAEIKLYNVDPAPKLKEFLKRSKACVFFSATLTPFEYYARMLGGEKETKWLEIASPFASENLGLFTGTFIDTRYKQRDASLPDVALAIHSMVSSKLGNYLVYLPSYAYLEKVVSTFEELIEAEDVDLELLVQDRAMDDSARLAFLEAFATFGERRLVGFAVMGGSFGEGIDLVGESLIGVAVVGVGLPMVCLERDLIKQHFQEEVGSGFNYAYVYPGMNRVQQTAGRVIRSETDRGVVCLLGKRFGYSGYRECFPAHWQVAEARTVKALESHLTAFWDDVDSYPI